MSLKDHKCDECGKVDQWVYLHARCHPHDPTWCRYHEGILEIICSVCEKKVATFEAERIDNIEGS